MDWYSVGLIAASGGLATLIATFMFGRKPKKKTAYTIVVAIVFVGLNTLSVQYILPELNAHKAKRDIESRFENIPVFASIKKYEPAIYQSLVDSLEVTTNRQQVINLIISQISRLVESRIPHASDEAIIAYINVSVTQMGELQTQGPGLCYKLLFPQVGGGADASKVFTQEVKNRALLALDDIIKTSNSKRAIPVESEVTPYVGPLMVGLYSKFGADVSIIENPTASNIDKKMVCSITLELYRKILLLQPKRASSVLRWMFGQA